MIIEIPIDKRQEVRYEVPFLFLVIQLFWMLTKFKDLRLLTCTFVQMNQYQNIPWQTLTFRQTIRLFNRSYMQINIIVTQIMYRVKWTEILQPGVNVLNKWRTQKNKIHEEKQNKLNAFILKSDNNWVCIELF